MTRFRLRYIHEFRDRHGKVRRYFRRPGYKSASLPGLPGSAEFMEAYRLALSGESAPKRAIGTGRMPAGTVSAVTADYFRSSQFQSLAKDTRRTWRYNIEAFRQCYGDVPVTAIQTRHLDQMIATMVGKPAKARNFLKGVRSFMRYCVANKVRSDDPTLGVKPPRIKTDGYRPWTDEMISMFRVRHLVGTQARLALELLLNVGARRGDAVALGPQNIQNSEFTYKAKKNRARIEGVPLLPEFVEACGAVSSKQPTFLVTKKGKPFTVESFGNWFRKQCDQAGIPKGYSAHGLRKASATRLANHGASAHQLMAWFGWTTLHSAERYTRSANKRILARSAGELLKPAKQNPNSG